MLAAAPVKAASVVGTLPLSAVDPVADGDLGTLGVTVSTTDMVVLSPAQAEGYFTGVTGLPAPTSFGATSLDTGNLAGFTFTNSAYGTFTSTGGIIFTQTDQFLNVYLIGTFKPTQAGFDETPASVQITYTKTGSTITGGLTLSVPPAPIVPEPTSIAMAGIGLATLGLARTFRKNAV
jgi:hypothetical protein